MAIFGIFKAIFKRIRLLMERFFSFLFKKSKDERGKIRFFRSSRNMTRFVTVSVLSAISLYLVYDFLTDDQTYVDTKETYNTEITRPDTVSTVDNERNSNFIDPLDNTEGISLQSVDDVLNKAKNTQFTKSGLDFARCSELMEKFKTFNNLTLKEKKELRECLSNPKMFTILNPDERKAFTKALEDQILSEEEKKLIKDLFGSETSCQEEFNNQSSTENGKFFLTKLLQDSQANKIAKELVERKDTILDTMIINKLDLNEEEFRFFKNLLEKCSKELLLKMLSDQKIKDALIKVLESAKNLEDALNQEELSEEEKRILEDLAKGNTTLGTADDAIGNALVGNNKRKKELAKDIIRARELGDEALEEALTDKLLEKDLTDEQKKLLDRFDREKYKEAYDEFKKGNEKISELKRKEALGNKLTPEELKELMTGGNISVENKGLSDQELLDQLAKDLNRKEELDRMIAEAQAKAANAAENVSKGVNLDELSKQDQDYLKQLTDLLEERKRLKDRIAESDKLIAEKLKAQRELYEQLRRTYQITRGNSQVLVSLEEKICSQRVKPLKITKRKRYGKKKKKKPFMFDGRELTADELMMYEALRKQKKIASLDSELFKPLGSIKYGRNKAVTSRVDDASSKIDQSFLINSKIGKTIKLSKNQKIAAVLMTSIHTTKGGATVRTQYRILHDVYDPISKSKVIPAGSIAHGNSGSFDAKTGIMTLGVDSVTIGGKDVSLAFDVGSGDNVIGLKGEIYDQNLQKIAGSLVAAFTAGAINAVQTAYIDPFNQSEDIGDLLSGATLGGAAEVSNQILQDVANDLQNSPEIYWVPSNIPVILFPR